jgi:carboxyl-terminal processing protease
MWLDPLPGGWDERPHEYTHIGVQLERHGDAVVIVGIATGSPAFRAGIKVGDEVVSVDGVSARRGDLASLSRRLEGPAGTQVTLAIRRGATERSYTLARRRLL